MLFKYSKHVQRSSILDVITMLFKGYKKGNISEHSVSTNNITRTFFSQCYVHVYNIIYKFYDFYCDGIFNVDGTSSAPCNLSQERRWYRPAPRPKGSSQHASALAAEEMHFHMPAEVTQIF